jgi:hypothetical protein
MSPKHKSKSSEGQWEQALIDAYYDARMHEVLDPLYEKFQQWKAGELQHWDMDQAIHEAHKMNQKLYSFFTQRREMLVFLIQSDEEWFFPWVADHPPPPGVAIKQPTTYIDVEEASESE